MAGPDVDMLDAPVLERGRVRLESLSLDHHDALAAASGEGDLWRKWTTSIPSPEGMRGEIERRLAAHAAGRTVPWAVCFDGTAIGMSTYWAVDVVNRRVEIGGTWLAKRVQGTEVNPAAKLLMLSRAFDDLDCIAVEFRTHWHNRQSRAAIARLGAKQDGVLRSHQLGAQGSLRDTVVFSIIRAEWPAVRVGLEDRLAAFGGER